MRPNKFILVFLIVLVGIVITIIAVFNQSNYYPQSPISTELFFSSIPKLNENIQLVLKVYSVQNLDNSKVKVSIPNNILVSDSNLTWQGVFYKDSTLTLNYDINISKYDEYEIEFFALSHPVNSEYFGSLKKYKITFTEENTTISENFVYFNREETINLFESIK